jgi:hypothetical protein
VSAALPRVTFGMIVLNGLPFAPYNLRALYPFAHEIIVVEGAAPGAASIAGPDGHSRDGTLEELRRFAREEDPEDKLRIVTAEDAGHPDGFWPGEKDEQSRAYAARAQGDYLWQVDADEFYLPEDMRGVLEELAADGTIAAVTFPTVTIWGSPGCAVDGWFLRRGNGDYHRLFRWGPGYSYAGHRPPTVLDGDDRDLRTLHWLDAAAMRRRGVVMLHYSLLFPMQVAEKVEYYSRWGLSAGWYESELAHRWLADSYLTLRHPYHVHNVYRFPSWLLRYDGPHPPQVRRMIADIAEGRVATERRPMADAERLLRSRRYAAGRLLLEAAEPFDRWARRARWQTGPAVRRRLGRSGEG